MIAKARGTAATGASRRKRRSEKDPLDIELSLQFNFGDTPADRVVVMDNRRVPMVGSVIANRDRILRGFMRMMLRTAAKQPRVMRELFPWVKRGARRGKPE